jgi:quinol monooxygenase YgiN
MKSNSSEIHLIASMVALPGKEWELREVLRGLATPSRNDRGCRRYDMYASDRHPQLQ